MSHGRDYPPPPGTDSSGSFSRMPPPPVLRPEYESYRPSGSRNNGGGRGRDRNRGRRQGGGRNNQDDDRSMSSGGGGSGGGGGGGGRSDRYHPLPPRPVSPRGDGPVPPRVEFTFRAPKPEGVREAQQQQWNRGDSYVPGNDDRDRDRDRGRDRDRRQPPSGPRGHHSIFDNNDYRGGGRRGGRNDRNDRRFFRPRFMASARPILQQPKGSQGEATQDFAKDHAGTTYLDFNDLSDSDADEDRVGGPSKKRARLNEAGTENELPPAPKWSNPDPYTVLPPTETGQKKKDVVHLIRKARMAAENGGAMKPADTEDFISCDMDSDSDENENENEGETRANDTNNTDNAGGRGAVNKNNGNKKRGVNELGSSGTAGNAGPSESKSAKKKKTRAEKAAAKAEKAAKKGKAVALPPPPPPPTNPPPLPSPPPPPPPELNPSRKRTHNDQFKLPDHAKLKRATTMPAAGYVVYQWQTKPGEEACPWLQNHTGDVSETETETAAWLHHEIVGFYEHVKPRSFEQRLRQDLIDNLERAVRKRFSNANIFCFGSFMSGLYLPTGDMDIVMCSTSFLNNRTPVFGKKTSLFKFGGFLCSNKMADREHLEHVTKAKVPLVKYVDMKTWLKVDVSFENMTGVIAVQTFLKWRDQYPDMPILVTLIKQFLTMRGLNEPVNGGIGGFSMICLVVSMLQMMPPAEVQHLGPDQRLGQLLLRFFDLYGNKFNYEALAISLDPPAYVPKSKVTKFVYKNVDRLSIIDPNNPQNDISGGSRNTPAIMRAFSEAYEAITERIQELEHLPPGSRHNASLLGVILEGDYSSYREQRQHLRDLYCERYGKQPMD